MRARIALLAALLPLAAGAEPLHCAFAEECYAQQACAGTDYALSVDLEAKTASDLTGDFPIVATAEGPGWRQAAFEGWGGLALLTMGATRWILSVHIGSGPAVVTYYGDCGA